MYMSVQPLLLSSSRTFPSPGKETPYVPVEQPLSILFLSPPQQQPPATTDQLSIAMDFPTPDISYKWNNTIYIQLHLAFFYLA